MTMAKCVADYNIIIPHPVSMEMTTGHDGFRLDKNAAITCSKTLDRESSFLRQYINDVSSIELNKRKGAHRILLLITQPVKGISPEAYTIRINSKEIRISASSSAGIFYGIQSLRKSIQPTKTEFILFPAAIIHDAPRFAYRGMHIDVSRHFFTVDFLKRYIDILALHNINRMHLHLTDDQGWRMPVPKYPLLTTIGAKRSGTMIGRDFSSNDSIPYSGAYTTEELRSLVKYASERHIEIIPEIDMPGHMLGVLSAYPQLGCTGGPYQVWTKWGVSDDVLCAGNPQTLQFLQDVFAEVCDIFPSEYIHIGGDECPKIRWKNCPKCQAKIKELGIKEEGQYGAENKLQSYIQESIEKYLSSRGRHVIGWDEMLEGGITPDATIMSWRGTGGGMEAAKQGHDVIMTPVSNCYFDYYQSDDRSKEPLAFNSYLPLKKVFEYNPCPDKTPDSIASHIIGVQANLWTEYIPTDTHAEYMLLPRLAALSEVGWCNIKGSYTDFISRLTHLTLLYNRYQYNFRKLDDKDIGDTTK